MLKALKKFLNKIKGQDQNNNVIWLLETPYRNY